jgi:hypothetical protein
MGNKGRIVLAKVPLTGNPVKDLLYSGWLYAAVANTNGSLNGLYVSKDFGQNWTRVQLPSFFSIPTNDERDIPAQGRGDFSPIGDGNLSLVLAVDPTDPEIATSAGRHSSRRSHRAERPARPGRVRPQRRRRRWTSRGDEKGEHPRRGPGRDL